MIDYEKKYKEALEWMKSLYNGLHGATKEEAEKYFPELKESEDEKIRKALVRFHKSTIDVDGIKGEDILAWLEKQGEQKPTWSEEDERLRYSCIKHIEEELQEISKDRFGHSEIISDLKEECRERINWLKSLKEKLS